MRKPRDFDSALKTLIDKTKALKENKRRQLGDLIVATGADTLDAETLAGGLIAMVKTADTAQKEVWRKQGAAFFRKASGTKSRTASNQEGNVQSDSRSPSARSTTGEG